MLLNSLKIMWTFLFPITSRPTLQTTQPSNRGVPVFCRVGGIKRRGFILATHLHLVLRLIMNGVKHLRPLYGFIVWTGTILLSSILQ